MVVMTLQDPDLILIEPSKAKDGHDSARPFSYVFVKTFMSLSRHSFGMDIR